VGVQAGLIAALGDPDTWVRYFAASSLGAHGAHAPAADPLARLAAAEGAPPVRIAALGALATVAPSLLAALVDPIIVDPDENVAAAAVKALAHVEGAATDERLGEAIRGPRAALRLAAVDALTARGTNEAVPALEWAAQLSEPPELAGLALDGLQSIAAAASGGPARAAVRALVALGGHPQRRNAVIAALGALGPERIAWLGESYASAGTDARILLVGACARLHRPEASALVERALQDEAADVRAAAVAAIGRIGAPLARQSVVSLAASDPSAAVRRVAVAVCRRHGWERSPREGRA
jgi:HEAT repeat protein